MTRVLIVDDEPQVVNALRRLLRRADYEVQCAHSGPEALQQLQGFAADVVLSDFRMPGMTGAELFREVKRTHPLSLRLIISGYADFGAVVASLNEGEICRFITKPWDDAELLGYLAQMLTQRETLRQLFKPFETPRPGMRADAAYREGGLRVNVSLSEQPFQKAQAVQLIERVAGLIADDSLGVVGGLLERHGGQLSFVAEVGGAQRLQLDLPTPPRPLEMEPG